MGTILIDVFPILLFIFAAIGTKPVSPLSSFNPDYLSIDTGKYLRGFFAIVVIIKHLSDLTLSGVIFHRFVRLGYLAVAVFFFLSGYGLQKSHLKSSNYKKRFLLCRLPSVLFPYIPAIILYWIMYATLMRKPYSFSQILLSLIDGDPMVVNSWYIISITFFYIVFWILMNLCKDNHRFLIAGAILWNIVYVALCVCLGYREWWYNPSHLFTVGIIWATYEKQIVSVLTKKYLLLAIIVSGTFAVTFISQHFESLFPSEVYVTVFEMLCCIFFIILVLMLMMKLKVGNPVMVYLGKISLELYLVHGLFVFGLHSELIYIQNDFLYALITISGSILLASALHFVMNEILKRYKGLVSKL